MTTIVTLENIKIKFQQLCWLIEHTHTTKQLNLLKEVSSEFEFKDDKTIKEEDEKKKKIKEVNERMDIQRKMARKEQEHKIRVKVIEKKRKEVIEVKKKLADLEYEIENLEEEDAMIELLD